MRMPFEKLMELVASLDETERGMSLGALSARWNEPVDRIADAITAVRVTIGERTYFSPGVQIHDVR